MFGRQKQARATGSYGDDVDTQVRTLKVMIRGAEQEMEFYYEKWMQAEQDYPPYLSNSRQNPERKRAVEARKDYDDSVDNYNELRETLARLTHEKFNITFPKHMRSSRRQSTLVKSASPTRGRGMLCSQPRDPRTGKFVSRYY